MTSTNPTVVTVQFDDSELEGEVLHPLFEPGLPKDAKDNVYLSALAAIEANAEESDEGDVEELADACSHASALGAPSSLNSSVTATGGSTPSAAAAEEIPGPLLQLPKAPASSPMKSSAPYSAYARFREARLARQRLMSPLPVSRPFRRRTSSPLVSLSDTENNNRSDSSKRAPACKPRMDFDAVHATMLFGLWKLGSNEDEAEAATPPLPSTATTTPSDDVDTRA